MFGTGGLRPTKRQPAKTQSVYLCFNRPVRPTRPVKAASLNDVGNAALLWDLVQFRPCWSSSPDSCFK